MDLDRYVTDLRQQLAAAAATGGDATQALAEQLSVSLDAATRLVLLEALAEAAAEITREIAPGSVDVRLRGREPEFAVTVAAAPDFASRSADTDVPARAAIESTHVDVEALDTDADASTSRTTIRMPDQLKSRAEKAAVQAGLSLNTWLVRAISDSLEPKSRRGANREPRTSNTFTGWAR